MAVRSYRIPVTRALAQAGFGDLPQPGIWALSAAATAGTELLARDLVTRLDISKQAVSQLVDALVTAGYVERHPYPDDRRGTLLRLTPRGRRAARVIDTAVGEVNAAMAGKVGPDHLVELRRVLETLYGDETAPRHRPDPPRPRDLRST